MQQLSLLPFVTFLCLKIWSTTYPDCFSFNSTLSHSISLPRATAKIQGVEYNYSSTPLAEAGGKPREKSITIALKWRFAVFSLRYYPRAPQSTDKVLPTFDPSVPSTVSSKQFDVNLHSINTQVIRKFGHPCQETQPSVLLLIDYVWYFPLIYFEV